MSFDPLEGAMARQKEARTPEGVRRTAERLVREGEYARIDIPEDSDGWVTFHRGDGKTCPWCGGNVESDDYVAYIGHRSLGDDQLHGPVWVHLCRKCKEEHEFEMHKEEEEQQEWLKEE